MYPGAMPGMMPGMMPGAMPGAMPGMMPGAMPGMMPGMMPGAMPGMMPGMMPQMGMDMGTRMPGAMPGAPGPAGPAGAAPAAAPSGPVPAMPAAPPVSDFQKMWWSAYYQQLNQQQMMQMWNSWCMLDRDRNGHIFAAELAGMTVPAGPTMWAGRPIGYQAAARLIQLFDEKKTRTIMFHEFAALHQFLTKMQVAFSTADVMRSGMIGCHEVYTALKAGDIEAELPAIQAYFQKFALLGWYGQTLDFMGFMMMCCDITLAKNLFKKHQKDHDKDGKVDLTEMLCIAADLTAMSSMAGTGVY